jgi:hypothetical protein
MKAGSYQLIFSYMPFPAAIIEKEVSDELSRLPLSEKELTNEVLWTYQGCIENLWQVTHVGFDQCELSLEGGQQCLKLPQSIPHPCSLTCFLRIDRCSDENFYSLGFWNHDLSANTIY